MADPVETPEPPDGALTDPPKPAPAPAPAPQPAPAGGGAGGGGPKAAAPVVSAQPSPPPVRTSFAERVAVTGSGAASEDAASAGIKPRHVDPRNGPIGRAQAAGGTDAIVRHERGEQVLPA